MSFALRGTNLEKMDSITCSCEPSKTAAMRRQVSIMDNKSSKCRELLKIINKISDGSETKGEPTVALEIFVAERAKWFDRSVSLRAFEIALG
jgi:hypothetical protein